MISRSNIVDGSKPYIVEDRPMISRSSGDRVKILHLIQPGKEETGCLTCFYAPPSSPAILSHCIPCIDYPEYILREVHSSQYIYIRENSIEVNQPTIQPARSNSLVGDVLCCGHSYTDLIVLDQITVIYYDDLIMDEIILVEAMPRILMPFYESLANVAKEHLVSKGVEVRTGCGVTYVEGQDVTMQPSTPRTATAEQKAEAASKAKSEEVGALVWVAGIGARPLVKRLAKQLGQTDMRGLKVDETLKLKGTNDVYAIGDAALSGLPPTAQVAAQQGKHIGRALRDGVDSPFKYNHMGSLICLGSNNGMAQFPDSGKFNVWDAIGASNLGADANDQRGLTGLPAFVIWRSTYWTKLLSTSSRLSLASDWVKAKLNGRDVVEPVLKRTATLKAPVESFGTELKRNNTIRLVKNVGAIATDPAASASAAAADGGEKKKKRFWLF